MNHSDISHMMILYLVYIAIYILTPNRVYRVVDVESIISSHLLPYHTIYILLLLTYPG